MCLLVSAQNTTQDVQSAVAVYPFFQQAASVSVFKHKCVIFCHWRHRWIHCLIYKDVCNTAMWRCCNAALQLLLGSSRFLDLFLDYFSCFQRSSSDCSLAASYIPPSDRCHCNDIINSFPFTCQWGWLVEIQCLKKRLWGVSSTFDLKSFEQFSAGGIDKWTWNTLDLLWLVSTVEAKNLRSNKIKTRGQTEQMRTPTRLSKDLCVCICV